MEALERLVGELYSACDLVLTVSLGCQYTRRDKEHSVEEHVNQLFWGKTERLRCRQSGLELGGTWSVSILRSQSINGFQLVNLGHHKISVELTRDGVFPGLLRQ